jgi:hypothetical protein
MMRLYDRARGCWERIEEEEGRAAVGATFGDVEGGGGPVHAPCPEQRVAERQTGTYGYGALLPILLPGFLSQFPVINIWQVIFGNA